MKQSTLRLDKNWEYMHPFLKFSYLAEYDFDKGIFMLRHFLRQLRKKLKPVKLFLDSVDK